MYTCPIPTPSEEELKSICRLHRRIGLVDYHGEMIQVYYRPWEDVSWGCFEPEDTILIKWKDMWFIQPLSTIEESMSSLLNIKVHNVILDNSFIFTHQADNWTGRAFTEQESQEVYEMHWQDFWLGFSGEIRRLEFSLKSLQHRLTESASRNDNMNLFYDYNEYLDMYLTALNNINSTVRERNYYCQKAIRAAHKERVTELDEALVSSTAIKDKLLAARPVGELEEDWENVD